MNEPTNINEATPATAPEEIIDERELRQKTHDVQTTMDFAANIEKVKEVSYTQKRAISERSQ